MAYKQKFGLSRSRSPLNNEEKSLSKPTLIDVNNQKAKAALLNAVATSGSVKPGRESVILAANEQEKKDAAYAKRQSEKSTWSKALDGIQDVASVAGLFPAYGNVVDVPNAILSGIRTTTNAIGDTAKGLSTGKFDYSNTKEHALNTALNTTAILPVAGQMATSGRLGTKAMKFANAAKYSAKGVKVAKVVPKVADGAGKLGGTSSGVNLASQGVNALKNKDGNAGLPPAAKSVGLTGLTGRLTAKMASFFN